MDGDTLADPECSENLSEWRHFIEVEKGPCFGFCFFIQQPVTTHLFLTALEVTKLSSLGLPFAHTPHFVQAVRSNVLDLVLQGSGGGGVACHLSCGNLVTSWSTGVFEAFVC